MVVANGLQVNLHYGNQWGNGDGEPILKNNLNWCLCLHNTFDTLAGFLLYDKNIWMGI